MSQELNVDLQVLFTLSRSIWPHFSVLIKISFNELFCLIPKLRLICSSFEFRSYYDKSECWLTCLFNLKSATILSNGGKPENVL